MKKLLLLLLVFPLTFASCSDDDDDQGSSGGISVVGVWEMKGYTADVKTNYDLATEAINAYLENQDANITEILTFDEKGKVISKQTITTNYAPINLTMRGEYTSKGDVVTITWEGEAKQELKVTAEGNKLSMPLDEKARILRTPDIFGVAEFTDLEIEKAISYRNYTKVEE